MNEKLMDMFTENLESRLLEKSRDYFVANYRIRMEGADDSVKEKAALTIRNTFMNGAVGLMDVLVEMAQESPEELIDFLSYPLDIAKSSMENRKVM